MRGGHPAEGRDEGARAATGDWLLFLDADVRLPANAVEVALTEMARERLDSASSWFAPDAPSRRYGFIRRPSVVIAARRLEKEGTLATSPKWLGIEVHRLFIGEIRTGYFRYFK